MTDRSEGRGPGTHDPGCDAVREALLVAEPDDLRDGSRGVAVHLEMCPTCRRAAERLEAAHCALDDWLGAPHAPPDVMAILAASERRPGDGAPGRRETVSTSTIRKARGGRTGRTVRWVLSLALAAGLGGLLLRVAAPPAPRSLAPPRSDPASGGARVAMADARPDLDLEVPADTDAAVFATADPDITVIWFLGGD